MARTSSSKKSNRVRLGRTDLMINRGIALVILLVGAAIVYSLGFSAFDLRVQYQWDVTPTGERIPLTAITCPSPWSVVTDGAEPEGVVAGDLCVFPARGLLIEAGIAAAVTLALAIWMFTRTKRPGPLHRLPLPIAQRERESLP